MNTQISNERLSEQFRITSEEWCDADGAATLLESTKSAILAQRMLALGDMPVSRAEMVVKGSRQWMDDMEKITAARTRANRLKVHMEYLRMLQWEQNSEEANKRAEMRL